MKLKKLLAAIGASALLASGAASAATVLGVTWNENSPIDFISQTNLFEQIALNAGDKIQGYGIITALNGSLTFCGAASCELTYKFSGYTLQQSITGAPFSPFAFSGGILDVYVGTAGTFDSLNPATAGLGSLWLSLQAAAGNFTGFAGANANTTLYGGTTALSTLGLGIAGQGSGYFNAVGGAALAFFDTNSQIGGTDLLFDSSFAPLRNPIIGGGVTYTHGGTAEITGRTAIPEPGALALLGIGLAGLGFARRNKKAA